MRYRFDVIDSTQRVAGVLARSDAPPGTAVVARRQEAGIGRLDHQWASPEGGVYISIVTELPERLGGFWPIAAGITLRRRLDQEFGVRLGYRWPNDLLTAGPDRPGRKVAGILVDAVGSRPGRGRAVVGVGINACSPLQAYPPELRAHLATLAELTDRPVDLAGLEELVVDAIAEAPTRMADGPARAELLAEARAALYGRGRAARVDGRPAGTIDGLADDGALELLTDGGRRRVLAGSVEVDPA